MRRHATEDVFDPDRTLCGRSLAARPAPRVNSADFDCAACRRVVRSRCFKHNVRRCSVCGPGGNIDA